MFKDDDRQFERVVWRSRRGMLELDLLLVDFAKARYPLLASEDQDAYRGLLGLEDWIIWDWLQRRAAPAPPLGRIVDLIVAFAGEAERHRGWAAETLKPP